MLTKTGMWCVTNQLNAITVLTENPSWQVNAAPRVHLGGNHGWQVTNQEPFIVPTSIFSKIGIAMGREWNANRSIFTTIDRTISQMKSRRAETLEPVSGEILIQVNTAINDNFDVTKGHPMPVQHRLNRSISTDIFGSEDPDETFCSEVEQHWESPVTATPPPDEKQLDGDDMADTASMSEPDEEMWDTIDEWKDDTYITSFQIKRASQANGAIHSDHDD